MEQLINTLIAEPVYGAIAVVLAALILYSLVKKVIKMMMFLVLVFGRRWPVLYVGKKCCSSYSLLFACWSNVCFAEKRCCSTRATMHL